MTNLNDIVGAQIRERRKALGLTCRQLAVRLNKTDNGSQVADWERGRYLPGAYCLCDLADAFGCTVDEILGRK